MSWKNVIALCGVAALVIAATAWSSTQEKATPPQQAKSQVALEKEYYTRILPRLQARYQTLRLMFEGGRVNMTELEDEHLELLFAQRRCGKISEKEYTKKMAPLLKAITKSLMLFVEEGRVDKGTVLRRLRRLEWFAVFGKADLNTPVGIPP